MNTFLYHFIASDDTGAIITDGAFVTRVNIRQGGVSGIVVYSESHDTRSDSGGLAGFIVGAGAPLTGNYASLPPGNYALEIMTDVSNSGSYRTIFISELPLSYALEVPGDLKVDGDININGAFLKVTAREPGSMSRTNLFLGWDNGSKTGTVMKLDNIIIGNEAGMEADNINQNILVGTAAGKRMSKFSTKNIVIGFNAGVSDLNTWNSSNIIFGDQAGQNITGEVKGNVFIGERSGFNARNCMSNICIGRETGSNNQSNFNIFIGHNCGIRNSTGEANTFVGSMDTGAGNITGKWNTFLGGSAGEDNSAGNFNTYVGHSAGSGGQGSGNTAVGQEAGMLCKQGSENVFLGHSAGKNENGSHRLYIANTDTRSPLIYGEFDNGKAAVNGDLGIRTMTPERPLHVKDVMRLEPRTGAPSSPKEGDMYMDKSDHKLKVFDGTSWQQCW